MHTHILPGIDDGAKDEQEARSLLSMLKEQGVTLVALTPHFYCHKQELSDFLEQRQEAFARISDFDLKMVLGSETYLTESLFSNDSLDPLCIGDTRYLLLEIPDMAEWTSTTFQMIDKVIRRYNVKPVIAHVEQYRAIQLSRRRESMFQELVDLGCLLQINADSLVDRRSRGKTLKMIKGGWADFVGSDCHNLNFRPPRIGEFRKIIEKKVGLQQLEVWNARPE